MDSFRPPWVEKLSPHNKDEKLRCFIEAVCTNTSVLWKDGYQKLEEYLCVCRHCEQTVYSQDHIL